MSSRIERIARRLLAEHSQTAFEYAWLGALIALVCLVSVKLIGVRVNTFWGDVGNVLP